jgi:hypothetical protein
MTALTEIRQFRVDQDIVAQTEAEMRAAGKQGYELFVLWTGSVTGDTFTVHTPHVPKQTSYRLDTGLCVRVDGNELHRFNCWLYETGETLGVQLHSHPAEAFHSDTDDAFPIVTQLGGLSIVLPDFAARGFTGGGVAVYRLAREGWQHLPGREAADLLGVI